MRRSIDDLLDCLRRHQPHVVFNLCEGLGGVGHGEAEIAGLVRLLGYPITGSTPECLALVRDKARTKWLLRGAAVPTADFLLLMPDEPPNNAALDELLAAGPLIVKPACEDASLGIGPDSIVTDMSALSRQLEIIHTRYGPALVERFIVGREFNVAIVALPEPRVLPLAEIQFTAAGPRGWQVVTYDAKWAIGSEADLATQPRCPAEVESSLAAEISRVALRAFRVTGCRQYARVDLRVDESHQIFVLEVNGNPDIGPTAGFARALRAAEMSYELFINQLVEHAWKEAADA
jgi:D-alanine-D-alanine ligase